MFGYIIKLKKTTTKHIKLTKLKKQFEILTNFHVMSHFKHCPIIHMLQFIPHNGIHVKSTKASNFNFLLISFKQYLIFFPFFFFDKFWQESYTCMWRHYGTKVMWVYLGIFSGVSSPTSNLLWWYRFFIYGGLCPICFSRELGFGGSISMFQVSYFW